MALITGTSFRMKTNTGTALTPAYTEISCEGSCSISITNDSVDTSSKCSTWGTGEVTKKRWSVSADGFYNDGDAAFDKVVDAVIAGTQILIQMLTLDAKTFSGSIIVDDVTFDSPHDGVVNFSLSGTGDDTLTFA